MKKFSKSLLLLILSLTTSIGVSVAEEVNADMQDIIAACTEESSGAIDVQEFIDDCVKAKNEELKEMAKEAKDSKEKS